MKVKRDVGRIGGWGRGGGFESNLPSTRGWTKRYFNFNSGGVQLYFKAYFANFRTPPPDNYCTVPKWRPVFVFRSCFHCVLAL